LKRASSPGSVVQEEPTETILWGKAKKSMRQSRRWTTSCTALSTKILDAVGLTRVKDTFVGGEGIVRGVSGGEKKRVTVAENALYWNPDRLL
jgi:ABC-type multidrug transport system ATPase subunit